MRLSGLPSFSEATKQPPCLAETGCQSAEAFGRISCPWCARAVCTGKLGALFLYDFVSGSLFLGIWVLHVEYGSLGSSGDDFVWGCDAFFDSGYGVCVSTWLLDEFHTKSTFTWTRILRYFSLFSYRMENRAQPMLQLAVPWCAARTWNSGNSSHGILVADMCDDGCRGQCTGTGPCQLVSVTGASSWCVCGHTHSIFVNTRMKQRQPREGWARGLRSQSWGTCS